MANVSQGAAEAAFNKEVGRLIHKQRKRRRFSQTELGAEVGVHRNTLMRWEDGEAGVPLWMILRIAYSLRVNHLVLLPDRTFTWGSDLELAANERDPVAGVQWERDPQIAQPAAV